MASRDFESFDQLGQLTIFGIDLQHLGGDPDSVVGLARIAEYRRKRPGDVEVAGESVSCNGERIECSFTRGSCNLAWT